MKTPAPDINETRLVESINAEYGLNISSVIFVPKGEEAYTYTAQDLDGMRYFIRVQPTARAMLLKHVYEVTHLLHTKYDLPQVVAPYATRHGTFTMSFSEYIGAVFPFIEGSTLYEQGASVTDVMQAATLLAAVHQRATACNLPALQQETFDNPFREPILHALQAIQKSNPLGNPYQHRVRDLLVAERTDILATLEMMERLQSKAQQLATDWVLTHGDPNLDNFLKDPRGTLHLTDWGEIAIGPPERDLFAFTGSSTQFEVFLQSYISSRDTLKLHQDIFAFYYYRWTMQEIADYATRILFQKKGPIEDEHAWSELQAYLPIRHDDITHGLQELQIVLDRLLG